MRHRRVGDDEIGDDQGGRVSIPLAVPGISAPSSASARGFVTRPTVLVVEDSHAALFGIRDLLDDAGFSVRTANNGQEALDLLELQGGLVPRAIVLDLMMPKVNGWELLKHLQADPELRYVPVLVMTALDADDAQVVGADIVLRKPVQPSALLSAVKRLAGTVRLPDRTTRTPPSG